MHKIDPDKLSGPISIEVAIEQGKLMEKLFRLRDIDVDAKTFHVWRKEGILDTIEGGKWVSLSFIEYLWVSVLESLRKFGTSRNLMKKIHHELFTKAYESDLGRKTLRDKIDFYEKMSIERGLTLQESEILNSCKEYLKDDLLMNTQRGEISYFYQMVLNCFTKNTEVGLLIYEDDSFTTYEISDSMSVEMPLIDLSIPHLRIPLTSFIKKFIDDDKKQQFLERTGIINEQEMQILNIIRNRNLKSISIFFNSDQRIHKVECNESGILNPEDSKRIMHTLGMKNYQSVELNTRDGKTISYAITKRNYM